MTDTQVVETEQAFLGSILQNNDVMFEITSFASPEIFLDKRNIIVFEAMLSLFEENQEITYITVREEIRRRKKSRQVKDEYLVELNTAPGSTRNGADLGRLVFEKYIVREVQKTSQIIVEKAESGDTDPFELLDELEDVTINLSSQMNRKKISKASEHIAKADEELSFALKNQRPKADIRTGYKDLDKLLGGWQKGDFVVIAARPSMGKSALAVCLARLVARQGKACAFFSLEMTNGQVLLRLTSIESRVNTHKARRGIINERQYKRATKAFDKIREYEIYLDDTTRITPIELKSKVRQLIMSAGIEVVFVDYLQIMDGFRRRVNQNREQEIAYISGSLKALAKDHNITVVAMAQLSRDVVRRGDKRPQLHDLRESGSIEQDADTIMFIHRPEYYGDMELHNGEASKNIAEILVRKNRSGPIGEVYLRYYPHYTLFLPKPKDWGKRKLAKAGDSFGPVVVGDIDTMKQKKSRGRKKDRVLPPKKAYKRRT